MRVLLRLRPPERLPPVPEKFSLACKHKPSCVKVILRKKKRQQRSETRSIAGPTLVVPKNELLACPAEGQQHHRSVFTGALAHLGDLVSRFKVLVIAGLSDLKLQQKTE